MKQWIIVFIAVILFTDICNAQYVFHKLYRYNSTENDFGTAVIPLNEGGYITIGITHLSTSSEGVFIVKINELGDTLWQRAYDNSPQGGDPGLSVVELYDNTIVICGWCFDTIEYARDTYLFKIGSSGDSIWFRKIEGGYNDFGIIHKQTPDGGFIIGGYNYDSTGTYTQVFLIKTDNLGNVQWQQEYGALNYNDILKSIDLTPDGGFIIGGYFQNPATSSNDMFLIKTDNLGNQQWKKAYGSTADEYTGYAITTLDNGFIIAGARMMPNNKFKGYLVKTDSLGNTQWNDTIGEGNYHDYFKIVRQLPDSSYIVGGTKPDLSASPNGVKAWLQKLSKQGDTLWSKTYNYYGGSKHTYMEDLNLTNDGGFIATGYIINNSLPAKNDLWLLKTDGNGNTCVIDTTTYACCWEYNCSLTHSNIVVNADTVYLSQGATVQFTGTSNYATEWFWDFGDGSTSTEQNPQHSYDTTGIFTVSLVSTNGICSDTVNYSITVLLTTIQTLSNFNYQDIFIFPNPASTELYVKINRTYENNFTITICDMQGNTVKNLKTENKETVISIADLPQGVFCVKILGNNIIRYEKIVKFR